MKLAIVPKMSRRDKNAVLALVITFVFVLVLFNGINVASAYVCDDDNNINSSYIPCEAITPSGMTCSGNVSIIFLSNTSINKSINTSLKDPILLTYNFTFDYNLSGQYFLTLCDNATATITVYNATAPETPVISVGGDHPGSWVYPGITGVGYNVTENLTNQTVEIVCSTLSCKFNRFADSAGKRVWPSVPRVGFIIEVVVLIAIIVLLKRVYRKTNKVSSPRNNTNGGGE